MKSGLEKRRQTGNRRFPVRTFPFILT